MSLNVWFSGMGKSTINIRAMDRVIAKFIYMGIWNFYDSLRGLKMETWSIGLIWHTEILTFTFSEVDEVIEATKYLDLLFFFFFFTDQGLLFCKYLFIYLAASDLSCGTWDLGIFVAACRRHAGSFVAARWLLSSCGARALEWVGSVVAPRHVDLSSPTRDRTHVPCIGRWILFFLFFF